MELHPGGLSGNDSPGRIAMSVDLSELDQVAAMIPRQQVIEDRGFTINELSDHTHVSHVTAQRHIDSLLKQGKVRQIGVRPGNGGARVYEVAR